MKFVSISLEDGNKYYGRIDGLRFFIGKRVAYDGNKGLMNTVGSADQKYDRAQFRGTYGFWADFIHPIAMAEGGFFHTLNTYDCAYFTFSFLQFAAHVPNGDFVAYLRALLNLPLAAEYFSDLALSEGRVCRLTDNGIVPLESDTSTAPLLDYLNPSAIEVEDTEVIQAAKFVHWVQNDPAHRETQVKVGIAHFKERILQYAKWYNLDRAVDTICLVIADIHHQGRGKRVEVASALASSRPLERLLKIGEPQYHCRLVTLRKEINKLVTEGTLGTRKYDLEKEDFV